LYPQGHKLRAPRTWHHNWTITSAIRRPDGVAKRVYLINGLFPGPTLETRSGDKLVIQVENALEDEGVSMHWHGMHMKDQLEFDGAVGITQCPIAPGTTFTYHITISEQQHGTFWYHAHEQVQRADGLYGGLIVHQPEERNSIDEMRYKYDGERLLLIGDWYHRSADEVLAWYMRSGSFGMEPVPDSLVINGHGVYNCSLAVPARPVDCVEKHILGIVLVANMRYRYRIVNTGSLAGITLRLDEASLTPIEVDGGNTINSGPARAVGILHPGERVDFILELSPTAEIRQPVLQIALDDDSFRYPNSALERTQGFPVSVIPAPKSYIPDPVLSSIQDSIDIQQALPQVFSTPLQPTTGHTLVIYTTTLKLARLSNVPHGFMNHTSFKPQSSPPQPLISLPRSKWDTNQLVPFIPSTSTTAPWVDLVINNLDDGGHPFHLHGYDFYILSVYGAPLTHVMSYGSYNPFDTTTPPPGGAFNFVNPVKKDTVFIPRRGYAVLRFRADNPGVWMLHCHLLWHQASGMAMALHV
ncbi:multicopper oxidase, partial [Lepidopterella palustris CBS 459.81]